MSVQTPETRFVTDPVTITIYSSFLCTICPFAPWSPASLAFAVLLFIPTFVSQPYPAPAANTKNAPNPIMKLNSFPKSQMLSMKLTNFLTLSTMVTVTAELVAPRRLTPVIHSNWVKALTERLMIA